MAWIKLDDTTPDKPEVIGIANLLSLDQDTVLGKLVRLWIWADQQTLNGNAGGNGVSVTLSFVDRCTHQEGFGQAMQNVGWLELGVGGLLTFPHFDRHNGQTAKQRALTSKRVIKHRTTCNAICNADVTPQPLTKALPEKEKEKEKENNHITHIGHSKKTFIPPTLDEVSTYCKERGSKVDSEYFYDYQIARDWILSNGKKVKDWKAVIRTWERNDFSRGGSGNGAVALDKDAFDFKDEDL
jgi:hypothetical protein